MQKDHLKCNKLVSIHFIKCYFLGYVDGKIVLYLNYGDGCMLKMKPDQNVWNSNNLFSNIRTIHENKTINGRIKIKM